MSQEDTFSFGVWGYPKSANIACRRTAFEAIGGFREDIRAAEDADLTYRLKAAGWEVERREAALVVHINRTTLGGLIRQKALWGAGGAWLDRTYPGSLPLARGPGLAWWALREITKALLSAAVRRDRDARLYALVRPLEALAWELGRRLPNERPRRGPRERARGRRPLRRRVRVR
jgi:GT2 family glycosyltransferase